MLPVAAVLSVTNTSMVAHNLLAKIKFWADISYRMLRIRTVLVMVTFEAIGYEAVKPTGTLSVGFFLVAIMLGTLYMSATSFNDIADEEVDKVNLANDVSRPLVTTTVTSKQLRTLGILSLVIAALSVVFISPVYLIFVIGGVLLSVLYSLPPLQLSHRGIFASLWLPLSYVVLPFLAGAYLLDGHLTRFSLYVLLAMYISFIGRILLKDFRDYEGDLKFGKLNFLVRHGPVKTCIASGIAWIAGDVVFIVTLGNRFPFLTLLIQPMVLVILYGLYLLAYESKYSRKLLEVLFIGRMGNAIALALLAALTLQAYDYSQSLKNLIVLAVGVFMALTAIGLWRDSELNAELAAKQPQ